MSATPTEDKALDHLVTDLRVALPGVQLLFAFLLTVPFNPRFERLSHRENILFGVDLLATAISCLFLIAPSVYHRLHPRRNTIDAARVLRIFNRFAIMGGVALAVAINGSLFLVLHFIYGATTAWISIAATATLTGVLWYLMPLLGRLREQNTLGHKV